MQLKQKKISELSMWNSEIFRKKKELLFIIVEFFWVIFAILKGYADWHWVTIVAWC